MSDAKLHGVGATIRARTATSLLTDWIFSLREGTVVCGIADAEARVRFWIPFGGYASRFEAVSAIYRASAGRPRIRWSLLDPSHEAVTTDVRADMMDVLTDGAGYCFLQIAVPLESAVSGGAVGVLLDDTRVVLTVGPAVREYAPQTPYEHAAALEQLAPYGSSMDADYFRYLPDYGPTRTAYKAGEGPYLSYWLSGAFANGSSAYYCVPAVQQTPSGDTAIVTGVPAGQTLTVYAATHKYTATPASFAMNNYDTVGRHLRHSTTRTYTGLARVPYTVDASGSWTSAHPPFQSQSKETETVYDESQRPWLLPAFITYDADRAVAFVHFRLNFQNYVQLFGEKSEAGYSWGCMTSPHLRLYADGSSTNLTDEQFVTLTGDGYGGGDLGVQVVQDPGGMSMMTDITALPDVGEHACFVVCYGTGTLRVTSPATPEGAQEETSVG